MKLKDFGEALSKVWKDPEKLKSNISFKFLPSTEVADSFLFTSLEKMLKKQKNHIIIMMIYLLLIENQCSAWC